MKVGWEDGEVAVVLSVLSSEGRGVVVEGICTSGG